MRIFNVTAMPLVTVFIRIYIYLQWLDIPIKALCLNEFPSEQKPQLQHGTELSTIYFWKSECIFMIYDLWFAYTFK